MSGAGWPGGVGGILLDVDGTLLEGREAIPGAAGALDRLRRAGIPFRLATNTTRRPRSAVARALGRVGLEVEAHEIVVPASLAARRIIESGRKRADLLVPSACEEDMPGVERSAGRPDWVVVGDLGEGFTYARMNAAFRALSGGAGLIALHRGGAWRSEEGEMVLDAGAFVAALEYAAGVEAELVGKPARAFFELAARDMGLEPGQLMMVGDTVDNDIAGGAAAGLRTALVLTGNSRGLTGDQATGADLVLDSIAALEPPMPGGAARAALEELKP